VVSGDLRQQSLQPTIPAISNDLAADHTRGRYNAISAGAFQGGAILGPVAAGLLLDHDLAEVYVGLMVLGCLSSKGGFRRSRTASPTMCQLRRLRPSSREPGASRGPTPERKGPAP
jgi:MFS family permease